MGLDRGNDLCGRWITNKTVVQENSLTSKSVLMEMTDYKQEVWVLRFILDLAGEYRPSPSNYGCIVEFILLFSFLDTVQEVQVVEVETSMKRRGLVACGLAAARTL